MSETKLSPKAYYEQWTHKYLDTYGEIFQAYRTKNVKKLLQYLMLNMGIKSQTKILDAGCGVAAPAIFFTKEKNIQIEAITISETQFKIAEEKVRELGLENKIKLCLGDFHQLTSYYPENHFDLVYFLESLGHAENLSKVIQETYQVLKSQSYLYIKDFFQKKSRDTNYQQYITKVVNNVNENYSYNVLDLENTILEARTCGFEIEFIKPLDFKTEIQTRKNFEEKYHIDNYKNLKEIPYAEWLELKFKKV